MMADFVNYHVKGLDEVIDYRKYLDFAIKNKSDQFIVYTGIRVQPSLMSPEQLEVYYFVQHNLLNFSKMFHNENLHTISP